MIEFVNDRGIYEGVVRGLVPEARKRLRIATADIKDLHVEAAGGAMVPFLGVLAGLVERGIEVRLIHAKEPGPNRREDSDRYPGLQSGMERMPCPRVHFKCVIADGTNSMADYTWSCYGPESALRDFLETGHDVFVTTEELNCGYSTRTNDTRVVAELETSVLDSAGNGGDVWSIRNFTQWRGCHSRQRLSFPI
jgi:hypothetical protein